MLQKTLCLLPLLLLPFSGYASQCKSLKDCTKMASELCAEQDLKLFGEDECVECCMADEHISTYKDEDNEEQKKCCPDGSEALDGSGNCCTEDKKYLGVNSVKLYHNNPIYSGYYQQPLENYYFCCEGDLFEYETLIPGKGSQKIKRCCNTGSISCDSGVLISEGTSCQCGCLNNWDCNKNKKEGDPYRYCNADHTCTDVLSFDVSGIKVEIDDIEGGKFTQKKAEALVKKIRENLLASTGNDKLKITFSGKLADAEMTTHTKKGFFAGNNLGFSYHHDKVNVLINTGFCTQKDVGEMDCSVSIIHENVHRVDNVEQPMWGEARKQVTTLYQSMLTEIHAQTVGALAAVRMGFENCYRYKNGQVYPTCGPSVEFNKRACEKCMAVYELNEIKAYAGKHINPEEAKRYYSNPSWAEYNNCNGLYAELEEDFMNSVYARTSYQSKRKDEADKMLLKVTPTVREAVSQFKKASSLAGVFGMVSRTEFLWNRTPSPSLVSDIAKLYSENATLCMSPERFMNHPKIKLGFESEMDINEFEEAYEFILANPECGGTSYLQTSLSQGCQEKLSCLTDQWRAGCWPVQEWASHIGEIETYTIN